MPSSHAMLGPSSAHRWLVCTPSAMLESTLPGSTSAYAEEGTQAHSLCERMLRSSETFRLEGKTDDIPAEMWEAAVYYADIVDEELAVAKTQTPDARLFVEQRVDISDYVPGAFGTSDAVIIADGTMTVIDFKYGKGVRVDAENNPQLRLYALGAYTFFDGIYDIDTVKTLIIQPRISHISSETITAKELLKWGKNYVKPRAKLAAKGEGDYLPGDHCRFCRAAGICRARVEAAFDVLGNTDTLPPVLQDEEIPAILAKLDNAEQWIAAIRSYAYDKAMAGHKWPGYKLVEGRSLRKITDPIKACEVLEKAGYSHEDIVTEKLMGISDLEKLLGKRRFSEVLGDLVVKPQGTPTLVPESDKRPEINTVEEAFKEEIE